MNKPKYFYKSEEQLLVFEFISEGPKGLVKKLITYTFTGSKDIYNLGFGDYNEESKKIDDNSITNNGDSQKILATVASTIYAFTEKYPSAWIFATGSTSVRTRLYRMGISTNIEEIKIDFDVYGLSESTNEWEEFVIGEDYLAFLVTKKNNKFEV
ncbi:MAG: hypothetical protein RIQ33_1951 [Bacteroidota bacterium]|jgi:hypothetical protein